MHRRLTWLSWFSPRRKLELYPAFFIMRIKVLRLEREGRELVIRLPLNAFNRNPGGSMFGGAMASLADPIAALMIARIFPGYSIWTRRMEIDFRREARSDLELRFSINADIEQAIGHELAEYQRSTPVFEYDYYDQQEQICAHVINQVAIRPAGYRSSYGMLGKQKKRYE